MLILTLFEKKIQKLEKINKEAAILFEKMVIYHAINEIPEAI